MANGKQMNQLGHYILVSITIAYMLNNGLVEGRKFTSLKDAKFSVKHRGTIKTIKSDDGDVIDCVDIYKQPAFDHPLLKNHTIVQMKPSSYPRGFERVNSEVKKITQSWQKYGECPEGTIPIKRSEKHVVTDALAPNYEYAQVFQLRRNYGANALINVWNPITENGELSAARMQLQAGGSVDDINSLEVGFWTNPDRYHDNQTRIYVRWTKDSYLTTGCYNLDCPGFVQTSNKISLDSITIAPISTYGGQQYGGNFTIYKDPVIENWWVRIPGEADVLGFFPSSIFTRLGVNGATRVNWGGQIINTKSKGHHTTTQMGSGHFSSEGYGKSSFFSELKVAEKPMYMIKPEDLHINVTNPACYDLQLQNVTEKPGFFYGGPGFSNKCP